MRLARIKRGGSIHVIKQVGFWKGLLSERSTICGRVATGGLFDSFSGVSLDVTCDKCKATLRKIGLLPQITKTETAEVVAANPPEASVVGAPLDQEQTQDPDACEESRAVVERGDHLSADEIIASTLKFTPTNN